MKDCVGVTGFEPATTWSQTRCATGLRYAPMLEKRCKGMLFFVNMQIFAVFIMGQGRENGKKTCIPLGCTFLFVLNRDYFSSFSSGYSVVIFTP